MDNQFPAYVRNGKTVYFPAIETIDDWAKAVTPMTDERYQITCVNDIVEWADSIAGEWNGDEPGQLEDRANQAEEIIEKCNELIALIEGMAEL